MTNSLPFPIAPMKKQKQDIQYGPAPKALVRAVRAELQRLINLPELDQNLGMIGRFAHQADDMLMCVKDPVAIMKNEHGVTVPGVASEASNVETYGASVIRQILPALVGYQKAQQETPYMLVQALVSARQAGMTDVSAELEKKLLGKSLDGKRPIKSEKEALIGKYLGEPIGTFAPGDIPIPPKKKKSPKLTKREQAHLNGVSA